mgnify:CR=1 FL=1
MGRIKYDKIYEDLKKKIESEVYGYQQLLPSENNLIKEYTCSRNTLRRAVAQLASIGYVQSLHGKGVCVIYEQHKKPGFMLGDVESFKEASIRNSRENKTEVVHFSELTADEVLSRKTGIPAETEI